MSAMSQADVDFIRMGNAQWQGRDLVAAFQDDDFLADLTTAEQAGLIDPAFEFRLVGLESRSAGIYTFRDGRLVASSHYLHEEQALEDAGLGDGP